MALELQTVPVAYASAHDDLVYVIYEPVKAIDPSTYPSYKYLADVYINGVLVHSDKAVPHPVTLRGIFNFGDIVRNYVSSNLNFVTDQIKAQEFGNTEFHAKVVVKFGEEYGDTLYTNILVDDERKYFNHYNGRMKGKYTILDSYVSKFASSSPLVKKTLRTSLYHFLPYFNTSVGEIPILIKTYNASSVMIDSVTLTIEASKDFGIQQLNVSPVLINTLSAGLINDNVHYYTVQVGNINRNNIKTKNSQNGSPYKDTNFNVHSLLLESFVIEEFFNTEKQAALQVGDTIDLHCFGVDPFEGDGTMQMRVLKNGSIINEQQIDCLSGNIAGDLYYQFVVEEGSVYEFQCRSSQVTNEDIWLNLEGQEASYGPSQIYTFILFCEPIYEVNTLHFLNQFGGYETFLLSKLSRTSYDIEQKSYGVQKYNSQGATFVGVVCNEVTKTYATTFKEKATLNTDLITEEEYRFLVQLILSQKVFVEEEGFLVPVEIGANNYDFKKAVNDRQFNLTVNIIYMEVLNAQYL